MMARGAVVGLGVGEQHARAIARSTRGELSWVCDFDGDRATRLARELGTRAAPSLDDVLADRDTDFVVLATYDDQHSAQVLAAFDAGKHVFCEKPLCTTRGELGQIRAALGRTDMHLGSNLVLRSAPLYSWLRQAIASGELGEVYAFDGDYLYGRLHKITEGWRHDRPGYSVLLGGGIHLIDLMMWTTGQRPESVSTVGARIATRGTGVGSDDFAAATYRFSSGMVGRITANFGCVHRHHHVLRVFGTKKTFLYDDQGPRLFDTRGDAARATPIALDPFPPSKGALVDPFLAALSATTRDRELARYELDVIAAAITANDALREERLLRIDYE
jgi:predicted dehydrogenase